jgi:hypothetical protein
VEKYTPLAAQVRAIRERFLFLEMVDFFWGGGEQRSCDGRGGRRPVWRVNEPKKTGAHSARARSERARTHGQNPLVLNTTVLKYVQYYNFFLHSESCVHVLRPDIFYFYIYIFFNAFCKINKRAKLFSV